jgi:hypothetical protein
MMADSTEMRSPTLVVLLVVDVVLVEVVLEVVVAEVGMIIGFLLAPPIGLAYR